MPAYLVAFVTVEDAARYREYTAHTPRVIAAHGGRFIVRNGARETVEGAEEPRRLVIIEFPSMDAARGFIQSPDYARVKALREGAGQMDSLLIEGFEAQAWAEAVAASNALSLP